MRIRPEIRILLLTLAIAAVAVLFLASRAPATPEITWQPSAVSERLVAGDALTLPVSLRSSRNLAHVVIRVVPALDPFVTVAPSEFSSISAGETVTIDVTISSPPDSLPQILDGTIQMEDREIPTRVIAKPLPVTIKVVWPSASAEGIPFVYPADWQIDVVPRDGNTEPTAVLTSSGGSTVVILPEGGFSYGMDPEIVRTSTSLTVAGYEAIRADYRTADGTLIVSRVALTSPPPGREDFRVEFHPGKDSSTAEMRFEAVLQSLAFQ